MVWVSYLCHMKILAMDYGRKRTGWAETDPLQMIASPLTTVDTTRIWDFLERYLAENEVETLVIGKPYREDGGLNEIEEDILKFIEQFKKKYPGIGVDREDERYTSKMALDVMIRGGMKKKKRREKKNLDKISASLILESYLNRKK